MNTIEHGAVASTKPTELPTKKTKVDEALAEDFAKLEAKTKGKKLKTSVMDKNVTSETLPETPTKEDMAKFKDLGEEMVPTFTVEERMLLEGIFKISRQFVVNAPEGDHTEEDALVAMIELKKKILSL